MTPHTRQGAWHRLRAHLMWAHGKDVDSWERQELTDLTAAHLEEHGDINDLSGPPSASTSAGEVTERAQLADDAGTSAKLLPLPMLTPNACKACGGKNLVCVRTPDDGDGGHYDTWGPCPLCSADSASSETAKPTLTALLNEACRLLGRWSFLDGPHELEADTEEFLDRTQPMGFGIQPTADKAGTVPDGQR